MMTTRWMPLVLALAACAGSTDKDATDTDAEGTDTQVDDTDTDLGDTDTLVVDTDPIISSPMDVTITPAMPVAGEALQCVADTTTTATYAWNKDGQPTGINGATLLTDTTEAYETWGCHAITVDGLFEGTATTTIGEDCHALYADGTATFSSLAPQDHAAIDRRTEAFTIEAWVYRERDDAMEDVISHSAALNGANAAVDYSLRFDDAGNLLFITGATVDEDDDCSTISVPAPDKDAWHHIAGSWDPADNRKRLFVDGVLAKTCISDSRPNTGFGSNPGPLTVGASFYLMQVINPVIANPFQGYVDEIRLSSVVRYTQGFVPATYHTSDADTIVLYHLNDTRTYGTAPDTYQGSTDASANAWELKLSDITDVISDAKSVCDTLPTP